MINKTEAVFFGIIIFLAGGLIFTQYKFDEYKNLQPKTWNEGFIGAINDQRLKDLDKMLYCMSYSSFTDTFEYGDFIWKKHR